MKATRHVYRFLLALFVALSLTPITAFAEVASQQNDAEIDIPIITVDNAMEAQSILESQSTASEISAQAVAIHVNPVVIRSGFSIPTDVSTVRFTAVDFQAFDMRLATWVSSSISTPVAVN